jgi:hypothetical protein
MPLLIGVGGTGQHVALAVSRLVHLGAIEPLRCLIIDADTESALTKGLTGFGGTVTSWEQHPIGAQVLRPLPEGSIANLKFKDLFVRPGAQTEESELFDAFFDERSAAVAVEHGMYGNPAVGSTVFAHAAAGTLDTVLDIAANTPDQVFVCGSFVGGTGAGVIHQLLRAMAQRMGSEERIHLIALLPWLQATGSDADPIGAVSMTTNMQFGTTYLDQRTRMSLRSACLLGIPSDRAAGVEPANVQKGNNQEYPHLLHVVASHYLQWAPQAMVTLSWPKHRVVAPIHNSDEPKALLERTWANRRTLRQSVERAQFGFAVLDFLTSTEHETKFLTSVEPGLFEMATGAAKDTFNLALWQSVDANLDKGTGKRFGSAVFQALRNERDKLRYCLEWVTQLFGKVDEAAPTKRFLTADRGNRLIMLRGYPLKAIPRGDGGRANSPAAVAAHLREQILATFQTQGG